MKIKTSELIGAALDWAVAKSQQMHVIFWGITKDMHKVPEVQIYHPNLEWVTYKPSTNWSQGGQIIERENITIIRANSLYVDGKNVPSWFAETDKWVGHSICTGYEGEYFDPCFMVDESGGYYGPTPLIAAMRCFVVSKLGKEVDIPEELLK